MKSFLSQITAVAVGGAAGTLLRLGLNLWLDFTEYPLGTVVENVFGSFLLGLLVGWLVQRSMPDWARAGLGPGFCGAFTTMSTLASDLVYLTAELTATAAAGYLLASLIGGITLAALGYWLGVRWGQGKTGDAWTS